MDTFTIVVRVGDEEFSAVSDGTESGTIFTGSEEFIRSVKAAIRHKQSMQIIGTRHCPLVEAGYESPLALTAALCSFSPGYTWVIEAPDEVISFIQWCLENDNCGGSGGGMIEIQEFESPFEYHFAKLKNFFKLFKR